MANILQLISLLAICMVLTVLATPQPSEMMAMESSGNNELYAPDDETDNVNEQNINSCKL